MAGGVEHNPEWWWEEGTKAGPRAAVRRVKARPSASTAGWEKRDRTQSGGRGGGGGRGRGEGMWPDAGIHPWLPTPVIHDGYFASGKITMNLENERER